MRTNVDGSRIRNNKVAFSKAKGRYKLSRISFPLATPQRTPAATVFTF